MAKYLNINTKEYPRHDGDLELLGWSIDNPLPENWVQVEEVVSPEVSEGEVALELEPKLIDGSWVQQWEIHTLTAEEIAIMDAEKPKLPWEVEA
mgnify:CR=1 FL=1